MSSTERFYDEGMRLFRLLRVMATVYAVIWSIGYLTQVIPGIIEAWYEREKMSRPASTRGALN